MKTTLPFVIFALTCVCIVGCGLVDQIPPPSAPTALLIAPAGTAFVVTDASKRSYLTGMLNLSATIDGQLCSQNGFVIQPPLTIPTEARFLRIAPNGRVSTRQTGDAGYGDIGQLKVARCKAPIPATPVNTAALSMIDLGESTTSGPLNPQMFAITKQGDRIGFIPMEYGQ